MSLPEFCPNPECEYHLKPPVEFIWYRRIGSYKTKLNGRVQRFRCVRCGRTFSEQTFSLDYYVKRKVSYLEILEHINSRDGVRKTGRSLGVSHQCISNRLQRLKLLSEAGLQFTDEAQDLPREAWDLHREGLRTAA